MNLVISRQPRYNRAIIKILNFDNLRENVAKTNPVELPSQKRGLLYQKPRFKLIAVCYRRVQSPDINPSALIYYGKRIPENIIAREDVA